MAFDIQQFLGKIFGQQPQAGGNMLANPAQAQQPNQLMAAQAQPAPTMAPPQPQQPSGGGFLDKLSRFQESDMSGRLNDMFTGWAMGGTPNESLGRGALMVSQGNQTRKGKQAQNQTVEWLKSQGMGDGEAKLMAGSPPALNEFLKSRMGGAAKPLEINGQLVDPQTYQVLGDFRTKDTDQSKPISVGKDSALYIDGKWVQPPNSGEKELPDFGDIAGVRKEVQGLPSYKNYSQAAPIWETMVDASSRDTKAADLNLVYGLGKMFDPASVVREGELVMVKDTSSLPDWLVGSINSLNGGARLQPATRDMVLNEAHSRMNSYKTMLDSDMSAYSDLAGRYQINPQDILPNLPQLKGLPKRPETGGAGPTTQEQYNSLPSGATFMAPDGTMRRKP